MNNLDDDYRAPQNVSPFNTALKYGLIGGFVMIVISLVMYLLDQSDSTIGRYIHFFIIVLITVLAIKAHRDNDLNGVISYGRGLGTGTLTALIMAVIVAVYWIIFLNFIDPDFLNAQMETARREMIERDMSDEEIEQAMSMTSMFINPWVSAISVIFTYTFFGFITSLIASAFIKK